MKKSSKSSLGKQKEIVLAGLASGRGATYRPVQVQKLFFLIDQEISDVIGGRHFTFQPYNYGPFDKQVYSVLGKLAEDELVELVEDGNWTSYRLTPEGQEVGDRLLQQLPDKARDYIHRCSKFVRSLSFTQLVSAIYKAYPDMRENSVFSN